MYKHTGTYLSANRATNFSQPSRITHRTPRQSLAPHRPAAELTASLPCAQVGPAKGASRPPCYLAQPEQNQAEPLGDPAHRRPGRADDAAPGRPRPRRGPTAGRTDGTGKLPCAETTAHPGQRVLAQPGTLEERCSPAGLEERGLAEIGRIGSRNCVSRSGEAEFGKCRPGNANSGQKLHMPARRVPESILAPHMSAGT
jgi:hypothetical protein